MGLFGKDSVIGFDYNHDGKIDVMDDIMFFEDMDDEDRLRREADALEESELVESDLDFDELEDMDEDERREAFEDAGLDPDDYDFD